ncbi:hypothetical protein SNE40_005323 [Patella caerulea]|uniref:Vertnin n=1 Tax=Patella caerulea TaxID=87958 RepID=A0AAN8PW73_PATCE
MKKSQVDVILISNEAILNQQKKLEEIQLTPIPGTMGLHQIFVSADSPSDFYYRAISCFCRGSNVCEGHQLKHAVIIPKLTTGPSKSVNKNFDQHLKELKLLDTFQDVKQYCEKINSSFPPFETVPDEVYFENSLFEMDVDAMEILPNDIPDDRILYPCIVKADGNCLPSSGSVFSHGHINATAELRVRILSELVLYEDMYLDTLFLERGTFTNKKSPHLPKVYAQYSDAFNPGTSLNIDRIKEIFRSEVLSIRKNRSFMGIWQIHALSSVLGVKLFSVYPQLGNANVRADLHRLILPRVQTCLGTVYIMWTSTRCDMVNKHWVPNHFVAVLPVSENVNIEPKLNITDKLPEPDLCVGKYVIVLYEGRGYPGYVLDSDNNELQVECMHQVGKKANNCFYWPKKMKDICWYEYENVVCIIEPLQKISDSLHFKLPDVLFETVLNSS